MSNADTRRVTTRDQSKICSAEENFVEVCKSRQMEKSLLLVVKFPLREENFVLIVSCLSFRSHLPISVFSVYHSRSQVVLDSIKDSPLLHLLRSVACIFLSLFPTHRDPRAHRGSNAAAFWGTI